MWSSYEFRTLTLDDGFAMGSSMMPQKKNPGPLELLRGRAGRAVGLHVGAMVLNKGLPSGYNRDFHEEKELIWRAFDMAIKSTEIIPALVRTTQINTKRMEELSTKNFGSATEIANYLVRVHDVPFRQAHHIVGSFVGEMTRQSRNLEGCEPDLLKHLHRNGVEKATIDDCHSMIDPRAIIKTYESFGGTGPKAVAAATGRLRERVSAARGRLAADLNKETSAYERCLRIARAAGANPQDTAAGLMKIIKTA